MRIARAILPLIVLLAAAGCVSTQQLDEAYTMQSSASAHLAILSEEIEATRAEIKAMPDGSPEQNAARERLAGQLGEAKVWTDRMAASSETIEQADEDDKVGAFVTELFRYGSYIFPPLAVGVPLTEGIRRSRKRIREEVEQREMREREHADEMTVVNDLHYDEIMRHEEDFDGLVASIAAGGGPRDSDMTRKAMSVRPGLKDRVTQTRVKIGDKRMEAVPSRNNEAGA